MPTVTLNTKAYNHFQLKLIDKILKSTLKNLQVKTEICGVTSRGWVQMTISGDDENVALHHLSEEIGVCPTNLERVEKFSTIRGRIIALNKSSSELYVDLGVMSPNIVDAIIPLNHLQAQLIDGRKVAIKKIIKLFGFCENLPLTIKILNINREEGRIEATLAERQNVQYKYWMKSLLEKLIIIGASSHEIKFALKIARCDRDIVDIIPLGLLEHAVSCKLGTNAAGIIPKIGKNLRNATFSIFNPRIVLEFLDSYVVS